MEKVSLVPLLESHLERAVKWFEDPAVLNGILQRKLANPGAIKEWLKAFYSNKLDFHFAIFNNGDHIGNISLRNIDSLNNHGEMVVYLGEQRAKGYGLKAVKKFIDYCFDEIKIHKIYITVGDNNLIARHLYRKCGFFDFLGMRFNRYIG